MREKLLNLMKEENLTSSRLAELLGIQPSGISHILKGRNNPSLDFIQKILRRFPQVNPDWLILGEGEMYRQQSETDSAQQGRSQENERELEASAKLGAASGSPELFGGDVKSVEEENNQTQREKSKNIISEAGGTTQQATAIANTFGGPARSKVRRVIVLFEDRTFESYEVSN